MSDIRLPKSTCPKCGYEMDAAHPMETGTVPDVGDFSICAGCGELNAFGEGLALRPVEVDELLAMPLADREKLLAMEEQAKRLIHLLRAKLGRSRE